MLCYEGCVCWVSICSLCLSIEQTEVNFFKSNNFVFQSKTALISSFTIYIFLSFLYLKISCFYNRLLFSFRRQVEEGGSWSPLTFFSLNSFMSFPVWRAQTNVIALILIFIFNTSSCVLAVCTIFHINKDYAL